MSTEISEQKEISNELYTLLGNVLAEDVLVCLDIARKHLFLDTVSMLYLDEFHEKRMPNKSLTYSNIRRKFRKALNTCVELGYCSKSYIGTTYYQTSDVFGGKKALSYDFSNYFNVA
ncbi:hypothetical protein BST92_14230 [Nonlabens arenilitoris]|uniref:Uncharacterized protein n=1 Tax=Nonlabens arenilitoris TaxID=1217969 RepID=A0A2S7UDQ2_9FLAO|nr:hypothetical protein [Nonlabens arenilitoris]PQJ33009.1 hypothetical protein BST92_14230 [Nonlabens arenilitoris]